MRIEYNGISSCQHADRITENGLARVRTWRDRADHSERSHLDQCQPTVSRPCGCRNILCSGSLFSNQYMLEDLMSHISHAGLLYSHPCHDLRILFDLCTDIGYDLFSLVHGHFSDDLLRLLCSCNGFVHIFEHPVAAGHIRSDLHLRHHFLNDVLDHLFIYRHATTSSNTFLP